MRVIPLPHTTDFTDSGPIVEMRNADFVIRYDYRDEARVIHWTKITFGIVYGFKYTEAEYIDTLDYEFGLVELQDSRWIQEMLDIWIRERGGEKELAFGGELDKVHHYRLYFDDKGLYDIICKTLRIEEEE
jgi:hypothetical protein